VRLWPITRGDRAGELGDDAGRTAGLSHHLDERGRSLLAFEVDPDDEAGPPLGRNGV
jgi:hypothetical protein